MAQAEFKAPHTFAFAGAFLLALTLGYWIKRGALNFEPLSETLIVAVLGMLWSLMHAALYGLGCAWGGVSRPRSAVLAVISGVATAAGFLIYVSIGPTSAPADVEEAKEQYTFGMIGVAYTILAPVVTGLLSAWISRRAPTNA